MAVTYLLDTSVVTRLRVSAVGARVQALDAAGLARTAMTDLEIGLSVRENSEWDRLMTALESFELVDILPSHFSRARQVQRLLAQHGWKGKVPDLLVAAVGEQTARSILHYDADFDHIASVTGQSTEWVVARGSIN